MNYDRGRSFLEDGQFDAAIAYFQAAIDEGIGVEEAHRELGVVHYRKGGFEDAIKHLQIAFGREPKDDRTALFLGMALERAQMYAPAIEVYQKYLNLVSAKEIHRQIRARLALLNNQRLVQIAREAIAQEMEIDVDKMPENTVAVRYFELISGREDLTPLQKGMADLVISDLTKVKQLKVVERTRLQTLINAMEVEQDAIFDPAHSTRMGRLLGASNIFAGTIEGLQDATLRLNASYTAVKTGAAKSASEQEDLEERIFDMEKEMVFDILDVLGITATAKETKAIEAKETEDLLAFLAYARGLDAADQGDYATAIEEFQGALREDPDFGRARDSLSKVKLSSLAETQNLRDVETQIAQTHAETSAASKRLARMDTALTKDFIPPTAADAPREGDTNQPAIPVTVTVER